MPLLRCMSPGLALSDGSEMSVVAPLLRPSGRRQDQRRTADQNLDGIIRSLRETENASVEDAIAVADSYSANSTFTPTRQVNVTSPTASNIAAPASLLTCASAASTRAREATSQVAARFGR